MNTKIVGLMDYAQYLELGLRHTFSAFTPFFRPLWPRHGGFSATAVLAPPRHCFSHATQRVKAWRIIAQRDGKLRKVTKL